eukprot:TRINITY_DN103093_c0_g1_i1.p1 TRINITY_DN103093_c0_g1~~TRINITY_DN103093_c0_g1_i1.p1  ORF type:complete len:521 (-),score=75.24 TRINITY_DN103093_c0_g1_i1:609-2144(-)
MASSAELASSQGEGAGTDTALRELQVDGTVFEVPPHYEKLEQVGSGAYSVVCSATDVRSQSRVAIKKISNTFEHRVFAKRALREIRILKHFQHENILDLQEVYVSGSRHMYDDVYLVTSLMETDLSLVIKSQQSISSDVCMFFVYQVLRALKYIHSADVVHRDIKPRNLLVNSDCDLRICDFGLARHVPDGEHRVAGCMAPLTDYVCTRWYRAPELLCSWERYSTAVDVWSTGCVFDELFRRKPTFPGRTAKHQIQLIVSAALDQGLPVSDVFIESVPNVKCQAFLQRLRDDKEKRESFQVPRDMPLSARSFLLAMLCLEPSRRPGAAAMLGHDYLQQLHCVEDEPSRSTLDAACFEFERRRLTLGALRTELFLETLAAGCSLPEWAGQEGAVGCRPLAQGESHCSSEEDVADPEAKPADSTERDVSSTAATKKMWPPIPKVGPQKYAVMASPYPTIASPYPDSTGASPCHDPEEVDDVRQTVSTVSISSLLGEADLDSMELPPAKKAKTA